MDAPIRSWAPGPSHARASAGVIDVWRADLTAIEDQLERLLDEDERARAVRILRERNQTLWIRSRGVLRVLLGRYLECDPCEPRFVLGPHGKPALSREGTDAGEDLRFNLSHSGGLALVAVTAGREIGVDVEGGGGRVDELSVAARVLGREQTHRLAALEPHAREQEFRRAWVAHEATVKCLGVGLGTSREDTDRDALWTSQLDVGSDAAAAVAAEGGRCELRCWEWAG